MPNEPQVGLLPLHHRKLIFWTLVCLFLGVLPLAILYTSGYRFVESDDGQRVLATTGGAYIAVQNPAVELYVNGVIPQDRRPFSSAFYVQGYDEGVYNFHTQGEGLETWVKNIAIYPQIVTQAASFNLPKVPQVRVITPWQTSAGEAVVMVRSTTTRPFSFASTSNAIIATTSRATTTLTVSDEYMLFATRFASTSAEWAAVKAGKLQIVEPEERFQFVPVPRIATTTLVLATSTKEWNNTKLYEDNGEVYARWIGGEKDIPYYYCLTFESPATTSYKYGEHVYAALAAQYASSSDARMAGFAGERLCRSDIRIDRKWQEVIWFDFLPNRSDLVLMLLEDGLYVVEIDDRSWQNVQLLYPGTDLVVLLDAGRVMVKDGEYILEVFTDLIQ